MRRTASTSFTRRRPRGLSVACVPKNHNSSRGQTRWELHGLGDGGRAFGLRLAVRRISLGHLLYGTRIRRVSRGIKVQCRLFVHVFFFFCATSIFFFCFPRRFPLCPVERSLKKQKQKQNPKCTSYITREIGNRYSEPFVLAPNQWICVVGVHYIHIYVCLRGVYYTIIHV